VKAFVIDAEWDPRPNANLTAGEIETRRVNIGSNVWRHPKPHFKDVPDPTAGPEDVVIKVRRVGFCGSDMHFFETDKDGYICYPGLTRFPTILGHEFSGEIVEIGKEVTTFKIGDKVTIEDMVRCGKCYPCRIGQPNHCEDLDEVGFSINGGFAEYVRVPARNCWSINSLSRLAGPDEGALFEAGALVEPFTVVYNAIVRGAGGVKPGAYAVVHGAGPIGLASVSMLRACGAAMIIAFEVSEQRRTLALTMGADYAYDPTTVNVPEVVMALTEGRGADLQVEAAGAFKYTFPLMEQCVALASTILVVGRDSAHAEIYPEPLQVNRATLVLAKGNAGHGTYPHVLRLMASGRMDPRPMVTGRYPFAQIDKALEAGKARGHGKILVTVA
jgi:threonine dehydrogenase-like Zn-dependent dehydrogenase